MQDRQPLDLAQRPGWLECVVYVLMVPLWLLELFAFALAVGLPASSLVDALTGPGPPEWGAAVGWTACLGVVVGLLYFVGRNQLQSKASNPLYVFRRFFRSRLLVGTDGVELGGGREAQWSEISGFEARRDVRVSPQGPSWVEVSAVMCLKSGEEIELTALGCFHDR